MNNFQFSIFNFRPVKKQLVFILTLWFIFGQNLVVFAQENSTISGEVKEIVPSSTPFLDGEEFSGQPSLIPSGSDNFSSPVFDVEQNTFDQSATLKKKIVVRNLFKKGYKADEAIEVVVENTLTSGTNVKVFNPDGEEIVVETEIVNQYNPTVIRILPPVQFQPGRYRLKIQDTDSLVATQEFFWGVLAINTNKSIYPSDSEAFIAMAVLDEVGDMVCNASLTLEIKDPEGNVKTLKTEDGTIIVNPQCYSTEFTLIPDYQASYQVGGAGTYNLKLSATTDDGTYSITDSFKAVDVSLDEGFDVERISATRFYPPNTYPVTVKIKAKEDFEGEIRETVPASFLITKNPDAQSYSSIDFQESLGGEPKLDSKIFEIGKPYKGDVKLNLGFGRQHKDPLVGKKYTDFGVLGHDGADFDLDMDTPVIAVDDGEIVRAGDGDYGVTIVVQHQWGRSYYGHLDKVITGIGTLVKKGQTIGLSGNTGLSSGPHLHFGIKPTENDFENGYYGKINPLPFLGLRDNGEEHGKVAGVSAAQEPLKTGTQTIKWNVSLKKGEEISLGYRFDAPLVSPELYLLGPLQFVDNSGKVIFEEARRWQLAADSVVVSGGIVSSEAQFGGLQRKVAKVNGNWYAFYNDGGNVYYKKSSNGTTWGSAVDMDSGDAGTDDYNPSIDVSGDFIIVFWIDDGGEVLEAKSINTASSDALTGVCTSPSLGTVGSTFMMSVAALSTTSAVVAFSDTSTDTEVDIYEVSSITGGTCSPTFTDVHPGNITFGTQGSGLTASDRPVLVGLSSTVVEMIFTDGSNLNSARYDATLDEWRRNDQVIAAISDSTYSVATDNTNIWVLTQNGTTATRLYHYPVASTGVNETGTSINADVGGTADDMTDSEIDMWCPDSDSTDCKIVYAVDLDTSSPDLVFVDCNSEDCSSNTQTTIASNVGTASLSPSPSMFCLSATNCKIVFGNAMGLNNPDVYFTDCDNADCSSATTGTITTDFGGSSSTPSPSIYCLGDTDCQVAYFDDDDNDIWFADCSSANCGTRDSLNAIILDINSTSGATVRSSIWCNASGDCQILYHDGAAGDLTLRDCSNAACTTTNAVTDIDTDVGTTTAHVPNAIDCTGGASDCKIIFADSSQNEFNFVDCSTAGCTSFTTTKIDDTAGGITKHSVDLDCHQGASDCKGTYVGDTATPLSYFFDCDNADCSLGSVMALNSPPTRVSLDCPSTSNCKLVYYDNFVSSTDAPVKFADCTNENCMPDWESLTAPWTSETNVSSVSLTYDSTNSDLIANITKDATNRQAYYNVSDATTISWNGSTAYDFTAGDMDNMSSPETAAGTNNMGVLVRLDSNMEFDLYAAFVSGPTMDQVMRHGKWFNAGAEQPFTF